MEIIETFGTAFLLLMVVVLGLVTLRIGTQLRTIKRDATRRVRVAETAAKQDNSIRAKLTEDGFTEAEIRDALQYLKAARDNE